MAHTPTWGWAFGPETPLFLNTEMGFGMAATSHFAVLAAPDGKRYSGDAVPYAIHTDNDFGHYIEFPVGLPMPFGRVTFVMWKHPLAELSNSTAYGSEIRPNIDGVVLISGAIGGGSTFNLRIDGFTMVSFGAGVDWTVPHWVSIEYDYSDTAGPTNVRARVWIDGVDVTGWRSRQISAGTVINNTAYFRWRGSFTRNAATEGTRLQQIAFYSDIDGAAGDLHIGVPVYLDADGVSTTGAWTKQGGEATFHASVGQQPMDLSKYANEATPNTGEFVHINSSSNINALLGTTAQEIDFITWHTWSTGEAITAKAGVHDGSGGAKQFGANKLIDAANTTYAYVTSQNRPLDAMAWQGTDALNGFYEVV